MVEKESNLGGRPTWYWIFVPIRKKYRLDLPLFVHPPLKNAKIVR
jgi:hypothetical protein